jgi:two-component system, NarL family, sensor histidine kinase DevS
MRDDIRKPDMSAAASIGDPTGGMVFAQVARLELDELLEQLVSRARDVQDTQSRLRGLLRAYLAVARADDLDTVLRHIVEAARELVNAGYGALGVVRGGRLSRFVHTGMEPDVVARVGHLPEGKGLLGLLVDYPQSLRLRDIADHVASVGFPAHHPPMRSFLGVPIRVADRVFGNLYLTDKQDAEEFTADDEELAQALAAAAAAAIENATLLVDSRRRHTWQAAMVEVTTHLLGGADPDEVLRRLVHHARVTVGGDGAGVSVPTSDPDLWHMAATDGTYQPWQGSILPTHGTVTGAAIAAQSLIVIADPNSDPRTAATAACADGMMGETVAVPMIGDGGVNGVLAVSRRPGDEPFDDLDRDLITAVAAHAGLALHLTQVRSDNEQLRLIEDRAQIAEDLRHRVIQRLFGHGLALQAAASRVSHPKIRTAIEAQIDEVDAIIRETRSAIFTLDPAARETATGGDQPADQDGNTA